MISRVVNKISTERFSLKERKSYFEVSSLQKDLVNEVLYNFKIRETKPQFKKKDLVLLWERKYNIFTMSSWVKMLEIMNSKKIGNNSFTRFITFYSNGISYHFRSHDEELMFEKTIGKKMMDNSEFRTSIINSHTNNAKYLLKMFEKINKQQKFSAKFIANLNISFGKFAAANTCIQRSADYIVRFPKYNKLTKTLIKQRVKYEKVMGFFDTYFLKMCDKIDKKNTHLLRLLTIDEFIEYIETKQLPKNLDKRENFCCLFILPKPRIIEGSIAKKIYKELIKIDNHKYKNNKITGTGIYPGKIKGKIQVIHNVDDLKKFKDGNILVCTSTVPEFTKYIVKAKGIISNEGGILSHSAVLSREFKIPGIVGTKIATKVLKDGDMVELDAEKGIVEKL